MAGKHRAAFAAVAAFAVVALTACNPEAAPAGAPPPAVDTAQVQPAGETGTDTGEVVSLVPGTAKSNNAQDGTGDLAPASAPKEVRESWVQLKASKAGALNPVVVNGAGRTLYRFDKDTANPSKATCNGDCAKTWPPVTVKRGAKVFIAGIKKADVGAVKRDDGSVQLTIKGWPIYLFAKDTKAGDTNGQGVGGTWFGVTPDGQKAGAGTPAPPVNTPPPGGATPAPAQSVILFDDANFSDNGASQGVSGQGCQNVARPGVTSSLAAQGTVRMWPEKDCKGTVVVVTGDVLDLAAVGFDNKLVSLRLVG